VGVAIGTLVGAEVLLSTGAAIINNIAKIIMRKN
jgi:hypothetical protein